MDQFEKELTDLLNRHNIDGFMNTADYRLADYICRHLRELQLIQEASVQYLVDRKLKGPATVQG